MMGRNVNNFCNGWYVYEYKYDAPKISSSNTHRHLALDAFQRREETASIPTSISSTTLPINTYANFASRAHSLPDPIRNHQQEILSFSPLPFPHSTTRDTMPKMNPIFRPTDSPPSVVDRYKLSPDIPQHSLESHHVSSSISNGFGVAAYVWTGTGAGSGGGGGTGLSFKNIRHGHGGGTPWNATLNGSILSPLDRNGKRKSPSSSQSHSAVSSSPTGGSTKRKTRAKPKPKPRPKTKPKTKTKTKSDCLESAVSSSTSSSSSSSSGRKTSMSKEANSLGVASSLRSSSKSKNPRTKILPGGHQMTFTTECASDESLSKKYKQTRLPGGKGRPTRVPIVTPFHEVDHSQKHLDMSGIKFSTSNITTTSNALPLDRIVPIAKSAPISLNQYLIHLRAELVSKFQCILESTDITKQFCSRLQVCTSLNIVCVHIDGSSTLREASAFQKKRLRKFEKQHKRKYSNLLSGNYALVFGIEESNVTWHSYVLFIHETIPDDSKELLSNAIFSRLFYGSDCETRIFQFKNILVVLLRLFERNHIPHIHPPNTIDYQVIGWLLDPDSTDPQESFSVPKLYSKYCDKKPAAICNIPQDLAAYDMYRLVSDLSLHKQLCRKLRSTLDISDALNVWQKQECPMSCILSQMEYNGIVFESATLQNQISAIQRQLSRLQHEAVRLAGHDFLITSPQVCATVLFDELKLQPPNLGHTSTTLKHRSTSEPILSRLTHHPLPGIILQHRQLNKQLVGFVRPLLDAARRSCTPEGQSCMKIFTTWNQISTGTGRLSSCDPNLQNLPRVTSPASSEAGIPPTCTPLVLPAGTSGGSVPLSIRNAFTARSSDYELIALDYAHMEMRILAHLSNDPQLCDIFRSSEKLDIYCAMAAKCFQKPYSDITKEERKKAKSISLGIMYGMGKISLAEQLSIYSNRSEPVTPEAANHLIKNFLSHFPYVRAYTNRVRATLLRKGYVETISGRKRFLPDIRSCNSKNRTYAERQSLNSVIQGSASDMMKMAMIKIVEELQTQSLSRSGGRIVLQIHDEIVLEVKKGEVGDKIAQMVRHAMENVIESDIPFPVTIKRGCNLGQLVEQV